MSENVNSPAHPCDRFVETAEKIIRQLDIQGQAIRQLLASKSNGARGSIIVEVVRLGGAFRDLRIERDEDEFTVYLSNGQGIPISRESYHWLRSLALG